MAKTYKQPSIVSGLSIDDILSMDYDAFNKLGKTDLQKVVGRLVSAGNKRLRNLEKAGGKSPAYNQAMRSGGYLSTRGKNINQLRSEFARARNFLESKTGSVRGYEKVKKDTAAEFQDLGIDVGPEELDDLWSVYERVKETDPWIENKRFKYRVLEAISQLDRSISVEERVDTIRGRLDSIYREAMATENEFDSITEGFEM